MRRIVCVILGVVCVTVLAGASSHAQVTRTWVSVPGSDDNPCSREAPCRTFHKAHERTIPGGEITVLAPGNFGAVTITKSISISNGQLTVSTPSTDASISIIERGVSGDLGDGWFDWVFCQVVRREAEALIADKQVQPRD